jgi:transposase
MNQWAALCRYTEDGALSIDNNLAERLMKLPAIGRKNFPGTAAQRWSGQ